MSQLAQLRKEYEDRGLDESRVARDPMVEFTRWLELAIAQSPGAWFEPNAMTLATSDRSGRVTARTVLLKKYDRNGLVFFTNYESRKSRQLADNPRAALVFHWPYLGRQILTEGPVERTTREMSEIYFHSRPRASQLSAAISPQSESVDSRADLEARLAAYTAQCADGPVPLPDNWGGFLIKPVRFEFWQGRPDRLHDRIEYRLDRDGAWSIGRLAP